MTSSGVYSNTMAKKNHDSRAIALHKRFKGKLATTSLTRIRTKDDLSAAYTPGVAAVSRAIAKDKKLARVLTMNGRMIAVVSDGSAVLGLGNIGPEAALPVMEGKSALFKEFSGLDSFPIVLNTQDTDEIIAVVKAIAPGFAGINLEDIAAPRCFEVEEKLIESLNIPVMHDDQHGTAIVVLAALINAMQAVKKDLNGSRVVVSGVGAAGVATMRLIKLYAPQVRIFAVDSIGVIWKGRKDLSPVKKKLIGDDVIFAEEDGELAKALIGADVFIGVSKGGALKSHMVGKMADRPVLFPVANPDPEISYEDAKKTKAAIIGTGRSDYPNQINNVLAFPGVFRGALDAGARKITNDMKIAAARAIAGLVSRSEIKRGVVVPDALDRRVAKTVARAVRKAI